MAIEAGLAELRPAVQKGQWRASFDLARRLRPQKAWPAVVPGYR